MGQSVDDTARLAVSEGLRSRMTSQNLQAAASRIRDADMASEMIDFTKNQILRQPGTAMLAQANQSPQSVVSLLR